MEYCTSLWWLLAFVGVVGAAGYILGYAMAYNNGVDKVEALEKEMARERGRLFDNMDQLKVRKEAELREYQEDIKRLQTDIKTLLGKEKSKDSFFRMKKDEE